MNRKLNKLLQPSFRLYFGCLLVFSLLSALFSWPLAVLELAAVACLGLYSEEALLLIRDEKVTAVHAGDAAAKVSALL